MMTAEVVPGPSSVIERNIKEATAMEMKEKEEEVEDVSPDKKQKMSTADL
jgi:hypothetical protein